MLPTPAEFTLEVDGLLAARDVCAARRMRDVNTPYSTKFFRETVKVCRRASTSVTFARAAVD